MGRLFHLFARAPDPEPEFDFDAAFFHLRGHIQDLMDAEDADEVRDLVEQIREITDGWP